MVKRAYALSSPHAFRHKAVLGRTVQRLAFRAYRFAAAGIPLALLHEARLSRTVKRLYSKPGPSKGAAAIGLSKRCSGVT